MKTSICKDRMVMEQKLPDVWIKVYNETRLLHLESDGTRIGLGKGLLQIIYGINCP